MRRAVGYVPIIRLRQDGDNTGTTPTDGTDPNAPPDTGDGSGDGSNPGDGSGGTDTPTDPTPTDSPTDPPTSTTTTTTTTKSSQSSSTSTSKTTKSTSTTKPNDTPDQSTSLPNTNTNTDTNTGSQTSGSPSVTDHSVAPAGPSSTTPIPPVQPAGSGTRIVDVPSSSFGGALSGGAENGQFATDTSVPTSTAAKSSGSSKVLPILLPCLLIPIALVAVLILVIRRRRQQHAALLDDFTKRSTFYSGAGFGIGAEAEKNTVPMSSRAHLNRSPSLSSSRHGAAYGAPHSPSGAGSHLDHSMPTINVNHMASYTNANPMFNVVPPTPRSAHNRTPSDDLDIKCAGRGVSTGSFSALYDEYARDSRAGGEGADDTMLAYDRPASATASMPDHPYSPTSTAYQGQFQQQQQQQHAYQGSNQYSPQQQQYYNQYQYQYQPQPQPQPQPPVQAYLAPHPASAQHAPAQSSSFFKRPQFLGGAASQPATNNPFTRNVTPAQQHAHSYSASSTAQPANKLSASQSTTSLTTGTTGAPQLQLPTFSFDLHNVSEASSPISAMFRTEDPFADPTNGAGAARIDGSTSTAGYTGRAGESDAESIKASAFPSPPSRVSAERRAARTRSVEQRLMMAMALNETNGANL